MATLSIVDASGAFAALDVYAIGFSTLRFQLSDYNSLCDGFLFYLDGVEYRKYYGDLVNKSKPWITLPYYEYGLCNLDVGEHTLRVLAFKGSMFVGQDVTYHDITITFRVAQYAPPTIELFSAKRCISGGDDADDGTYVKYSVVASVNPANDGLENKNEPLFQVRYRVKGTEPWTYVTIEDAVFVVLHTDVVLDLGLSAGQTFDFEVYITDLWKSAMAATLIPKDNVPFSWDEGRFALGKVTTQDGFDCDMDADFRKSARFRGTLTFDEAPDYADPAAAVRALGLAPLDASAFPPMVTDYMQNSETGNAFALESQSSGTFERQNPETNHPGIVGVKTSSTANSGGRSKLGLNTFFLGGGEVYEHIFRVVYTSNTTGKYGLHDSYTSAAPANGAWINVSGTTLTGKTRNASTESTTASSYTITANTWYHCRVAVNAAATLVTFSLYAEDGALLWSDTLSTNIPTTAGLTACAVATNSGTTARIINDFDWTLFRIDRALVR